MVETDLGRKDLPIGDVKGGQANGDAKDIELKVVTVDPSKQYNAEKNSNVEKVGFEKAIELAGYGKFHYFLLATCGFVSTSEEMDVISMSFILPSAQCDLNLNTHTKGWLNCIIFIGMMAGAYAWGSVADSLGRKKVLIAISVMNAVCIVASSFCQSYELFMLCRFLNGAALGGSGPVIWSYFAEFQPKSKRGSMLSFMAAFWTLGNLFVACLAWLIIPSSIGYFSSAFKYNSWRIFLLVCSLPSFVVAVLLIFLPESPKFLLSQGDREGALNIFRKIYGINTGKPRDLYPVCSLPSFVVAVLLIFLPESPKFLLSQGDREGALNIFRKIYGINTGKPRDLYPVKELLDEFPKSDEEIENEKEQEKVGQCRNMMSDIVDNSKQLFISPILKFTLISITINFTFHIGYYGLMMWFPELFNRFNDYSQAHKEQETSVCEVIDYVVKTGLESKEKLCSDKMESDVFMESLITVAAAIPSNVLAVLFMDKLGRKFFLVFSTFSSGLCAIGMYFVTNTKQNLIVSAVFSSVISCGNAALDCLITEIFPTNLRATGVAISMVAARLGGIIGNIVIATLLDMYCPAPTFIVAALLIGGGLLCLMLPNTTRAPLS